MLKYLLPLVALLAFGCTGRSQGFTALTGGGLSGTSFTNFKLVKEIPDERAPLFRLKSVDDVLFVKSYEADPSDSRKLREDNRLAVDRLPMIWTVMNLALPGLDTAS